MKTLEDLIAWLELSTNNARGTILHTPEEAKLAEWYYRGHENAWTTVLEKVRELQANQQTTTLP
ncbi:MAG: hypothetical protein EOO39_00210 [Cytophagaceae bacterium]|nr:MAG: hypothetical protein EOO39_00210 [Cytophagaceae bacterium]